MNVTLSSEGPKTPIRAHTQYSSTMNLYYATLLGGEFDNCSGQGESPEGALQSLKMTVRAKRNEQSRKEL